MLTIVSHESVGRGEKPPTVTRGQSSRLPWAWTGLCFGVAFHQSGTEGVRDTVNNIAPSSQTNVTWTRDSGGNTAANMTNSSYIQYSDNPTHDQPSTELTVYVRLKWAGTSDAWGGIAINRISLSSPWSTWALNQWESNPGTVQGQITVGGQAWPTVPVATTLPTGEFSNIFLRWRSGEQVRHDAFGERGQTILSGISPDPATGTLTYQAGEGIRINASEDPAGNFSGHYSQVLVWNRKLTVTEMVWMTQDPFGWYSPRRETIAVGSPYPLVFGGGEMHGSTGQAGGLH
jgi:hypothetical protein